MRDIRAIIFDFDGVLVDSLNIWKNIDCEVFNYLGISLDTVEEFGREICGMNIIAVAQYYIDRYGVKQTPEEIEKYILNTAIRNFIEVVKLKKDVKSFLDFASSHDIVMAIASSNEKDIIKQCLIANGLEKYFSEIVTSSEVERHKPHPDVYLKTAMLLGINPRNCLVFEDTLNGVMAGQDAGMTVYGMYDSYSEYQVDMIKMKCDKYFKDFTEALNFMNGDGIEELKGAFYEKGLRKRA